MDGDAVSWTSETDAEEPELMRLLDSSMTDDSDNTSVTPQTTAESDSEKSEKVIVYVVSYQQDDDGTYRIQRRNWSKILNGGRQSRRRRDIVAKS